MFKRFNRIAAGVFLAASVCAIAVICACTKKPAGQTFIGTGNGRNGKIEVSITVSNDKIVDCTVVSHEETPGISDPALTGIIEQVKKTGDANRLDIVSGGYTYIQWRDRSYSERFCHVKRRRDNKRRKSF